MREQTKVEWIAARLKQLRNLRGFTQQQLADRLGLGTHGRIADYEQLRNVPQMVKFLELLDALAISPAEFFRDMPTIKKIGNRRIKDETE